MKIIECKSYRSKPLVNMTEDMQRLILIITGTNYEIRQMVRCLENNKIYFNDSKEDK